MRFEKALNSYYVSSGGLIAPFLIIAYGMSGFAGIKFLAFIAPLSIFSILAIPFSSDKTTDIRSFFISSGMTRKSYMSSKHIMCMLCGLISVAMTFLVVTICITFDIGLDKSGYGYAAAIGSMSILCAALFSYVYEFGEDNPKTAALMFLPAIVDTIMIVLVSLFAPELEMTMACIVVPLALIISIILVRKGFKDIERRDM